jgi:predicted N-acetyltransferase YhbS
MTDVNIRPAGQDDADKVFVLLCQFATSYRPDRAAFDRHFPLLLKATEDRRAHLLVAEVDGQVVGYALACMLLVLYANGVVVELQELMVESAYRDQGIGQRLVRTVVQRARAAGAVEVTVPTRRARQYYLRLGFEETATHLKHRLATTQ